MSSGGVSDTTPVDEINMPPEGITHLAIWTINPDGSTVTRVWRVTPDSAAIFASQMCEPHAESLTSAAQTAGLIRQVQDVDMVSTGPRASAAAVLSMLEKLGVESS